MQDNSYGLSATYLVHYYPKMNRPIIHVTFPYRTNIRSYFNGSSPFGQFPNVGVKAFKFYHHIFLLKFITYSS